MLAQTVLALEHTPSALVFRSHESLVTGTSISHQRSMALSYTNRFIALIEPWIAIARPASRYPVQGARYRCGSVQSGGDKFLLITSDQQFGDQILAGDGKAIEVLLPPDHRGQIAWRITDFSATRIDIQSTPEGAKLEIVSPDVAELVVISGDASLGAKLARSASRFATKAATDRWQLCDDHWTMTDQAWNHAITTGATQASMPVDLLTVARRTLSDAEPAYRSGDSETTLRLARRADVWVMRAGVLLTNALKQPSSKHAPSTNQPINALTSIPPIDDGRAMLQVAWQPLMADSGWSDNLIASGGLDQPEVLEQQGWKFTQRTLPRANSEIDWIQRGYFDGRGAIRMSASSTTNQPLNGGYEGTIALLSSPSTQIEPSQAVRVDAMIRTIGFGGPHQGVLVYDSLGGQEIGVLVRNAADWTPVRLYRQSTDETKVQVMFEIIGDGEVIIDEVTVRVWDPKPIPELPQPALRLDRISASAQDETQTR